MISVIIPSYNRAETLERAAQSVLDQTYTDLELIIVDDCSSDNTAEVAAAIAEMDSRVRYIRHEVNGGACAARNTGIDAARGEYIAFQDSDDTWRAQKLEIQLQMLEKYDADICYCRMERHNYPAGMKIHYPEDLSEGLVDYATLICGNHASTQTILARAEVCREHRFDPDMRKWQDLDWCIRAAHNNRVAYTAEVLADIYLQADSISAPKDRKKTLATSERLLYKYPDVAEEVSAFHVMLLNQIGYVKTLLSDRTGDEFRQVYRITGSKKALTKHVLYKLGLLGRYYRKKICREEG